MKQTDLFAEHNSINPENIPLALRMAPRTLEEYAGQQHILGPGKLLRRAIESDRLSSLIFYGPPGTGKSALARIIARRTQAHFEEANAVIAGIAEIRKLIEQAKLRRTASGTHTILLIDEIHHFNRSQQDALLPDVEKGNITLIGITTENPYFYVNPALLSRSVIFEFKHLAEADLVTIVRRALEDTERGLGKHKVHLHDNALKQLIAQSNGDGRRLLNALEIGTLSTKPGEDDVIEFDLSVAEESLQRKSILYDKSGDEHYDNISAFIKSMRGSNPDAALYWMSKMLAAGEDLLFVMRRVVIFAAEDVGNADPHALMVATEALRAVEFLGMPEGKIPLAQAVTYVASAPKSNAAYLALHKAEEEVLKGKIREVPNHLKDATLDGEGRFGHGKGYKYPHDFPGHFVEQEYWPDPKVFYEPSDQGYELKIAERLNHWRKKTGAARGTEKQQKRSQ